MPSFAEKGFATYIHNGTDWVELNSNSETTGNNVYIRTSGSGTVDTDRVLGMSVHDGTQWRQAYEAYVLPLPDQPATVTGFTYNTTISPTWNAKIDETSFTWNAVALPNGATSLEYELDVLETSTSTTALTTYVRTGTSSGSIPIPTEGVTRWFRIRAVAKNAKGSTFGFYTSPIRVISGRALTSSQTYNEPAHSLNYWTFGRLTQVSCSKAGLSYSRTTTASTITDPKVPGCRIATTLEIITGANGARNYNGNYIEVLSPLGAVAYYTESLGKVIYSVNVPGGGGTWRMNAVIVVGAAGSWQTINSSCGSNFDGIIETGTINISGVTVTANTT